tara:strand:- start:7159 stop:7629 length:471 start_codon:yes stop_codon:yes gene_type:complete
MSKLKNKFGKYFEFKNTTNGTDYFLRGLATVLFLIPIGLFVGIGLAILNSQPVIAAILIGLACLTLVPMIWFSLATSYKRINAFFPGKAGWLVAVTFIYSFILEAFNPTQSMNLLDEPAGTLPNGDYITYLVLFIPSLVWSLYLLFGNSKVKKHIG